MTSAARHSLPTVQQIAEALKPVLAVGVPIRDTEAAAALSDLGALMDWTNKPAIRRRIANELIRKLLQEYPDEGLAEAAQILFGDSKPRYDKLEDRRQNAATALAIGAADFIPRVEEEILATLGYQIFVTRWPALEQRPERTGSFAFKSVYVCIVLLFVSAGLSWPDVRINIALASAGTFIALLAGITRIAARRRAERRRIEARPEVRWPDPYFLMQCQQEGKERLAHSRAAIPLMVEMLLTPSQFRMRTSESISLEGRSIKQRVSVDFSFSETRDLLPDSPGGTSVGAPAPSGMYVSQPSELSDVDENSAQSVSPQEESHPDASEDTLITLNTLVVGGTRHLADAVLPVPQLLYVPILVPRKGQLMDRFEITRSDGRAAISLSYRQSLRVLSLGLRLLIRGAVPKLGSDAPEFDKVEAQVEFKAAELQLLALIARRGPIDTDSGEWTVINSIVDRALQDIAMLYEVADPITSVDVRDRRRSEALGPVRRYVIMLASSYPIIVSLPNTDPQPRRRLQFERVIVSRPREIARLRLWLGLRPNYVEVPINLAFETDSYHLEVVGPPEYYASQQFVGCDRCNRRLRSDWRGVALGRSGRSCGHAGIGTDDDCYVRIRARLGQNYSHAYMRGLAMSRLEAREMVARVRFAEAPPGVEERALFSATMAIGAFAVLGYVFSNYQHVHLPTDVPLVFLAVPGLAAAWFGFSSDADTILRSSLTARVSLIVTTFLSMFGIACYLLQHVLALTATSSWTFVGISQVAWLAIIGAALVNFAWIMYKASTRMMHFVWVSSRWESYSVGSGPPSWGSKVRGRSATLRLARLVIPRAREHTEQADILRGDEGGNREI